MEPLDSIDLTQPSLWKITTTAGTILILAISIDPATGQTILTLTRFATAGNDSYTNGSPLTVHASQPPRLGERWNAQVLACDRSMPFYFDVVSGGDNARYSSTRIVSIERITYGMLALIPWRAPM